MWPLHKHYFCTSAFESHDTLTFMQTISNTVKLRISIILHMFTKFFLNLATVIHQCCYSLLPWCRFWHPSVRILWGGGKDINIIWLLAGSNLVQLSHCFHQLLAFFSNSAKVLPTDEIQSALFHFDWLRHYCSTFTSIPACLLTSRRLSSSSDELDLQQAKNLQY